MVSIPREILMRILGFGDFDNRDGFDGGPGSRPDL